MNPFTTLCLPWQTQAQYWQTVSTIMQQRIATLEAQTQLTATLAQQLCTAKTPSDAAYALAQYQGQCWLQWMNLNATTHSQRTQLAKLWSQQFQSVMQQSAPQSSQQQAPTAEAPKAQASAPQAETKQPRARQPITKVGKMSRPNLKMVIDVPTYLPGTFIPAQGSQATQNTQPQQEDTTSNVTPLRSLSTAQSVARNGAQASTFASTAGTRRSVVASRTARHARAR